jgi:hypothetical protein
MSVDPSLGAGKMHYLSQAASGTILQNLRRLPVEFSVSNCRFRVFEEDYRTERIS